MPLSFQQATARVRRSLLSALLSGALVSACAAGTHRPSTVAEGKYFSSGHPQYDEFFIGLYSLQVQMKDAPAAPEAERRSLAQALGLGPRASFEEVAEALRKRALAMQSSGVSLRLVRQPAPGRVPADTALVQSSAPLSDPQSSNIIGRAEHAASAFLRSSEQMATTEASLTRLERETIALDAGVSSAFSQASVSKREEVRSNLNDAHRLIALMRARAIDVHAASEASFTALSRALDTDAGSLLQPSLAAAADQEGSPTPAKAADTKRKAENRAPRRAKPASVPLAGATTAPSRAQAPRPPPKQAAATREFEP